MWGRAAAPSVIAVIDDEPTPRRQDGGPLAVVGLLVAVVAVALLIGRLFGWLQFDFHPFDLGLPRWLRWIGPVLGVGKLVFLVGLGVLAVFGEWERRRRQEGRSS